MASLDPLYHKFVFVVQNKTIKYRQTRKGFATTINIKIKDVYNTFYPIQKRKENTPVV